MLANTSSSHPLKLQMEGHSLDSIVLSLEGPCDAEVEVVVFDEAWPR